MPNFATAQDGAIRNGYQYLSTFSPSTLNAYSAIVSSSTTIVDVFIYDTTKDSDGGEWRLRCQNTSWYNEALNTATRGATRMFPALALIVAEAAKITIYDATDSTLPMWMVFTTGNVYFIGGTTLSSVWMVDGYLFAGLALYFGFCNFIDETMKERQGSALHNFSGGIIARNSYRSYTSSSVTALASSTINDVTATVLPGAPIDALTGLPVPTVVVGTAGGVSIIHDSGTVVNSASTWDFPGVFIAADFSLHAPYGTAYSGYARNIGSLGAGFSIDWYTNESIPAILYPVPGGGLALSGGGGRIMRGSGGGISTLKENTITPASGMVNYTTKDWISGWMPGDIRGAWLADSVAGVIGEPAIELVTNGTFAADLTGWTVSGATVWDAGTAKVWRYDINSPGGVLQNSFPTEIGKTYQLSFTITERTSTIGSVFRIGSTLNGTDYTYESIAGLSGTFTRTFTATTATTYFRIECAHEGYYFKVDNVSCKVTNELVANGDFAADLTGWNSINAVWSSIGAVISDVSNADGSICRPITTEAGKQYCITLDVTAHDAGADLYVFAGTTVRGNELRTAIYSQVPVGSINLYFTAVSALSYLSFHSTDTDTSITVKNVSCRPVESDRSVKAKGLAVYGSLTKTPVAAGSDLVAYSGFSAENYLEQPYSADLDVGTGDFCIMGWLKETSNTGIEIVLCRCSYNESAFTGGGFLELLVNIDGTLQAYISDDNVLTYDTICSGVAVDDSIPHLVLLICRAGKLELWIDDGKAASDVTISAAVLGISNSSATLVIGKRQDNFSDLLHGSVALWRTMAYAPTAEDIAFIYAQEAPLFQANTKCLLGGTSNVVQALSYDEDVNNLYVGTADGISTFNGLARTAYVQKPAGSSGSANIKALASLKGGYLAGTVTESYGTMPSGTIVTPSIASSGLIFEGAGTNLVQYSEDFPNAWWQTKARCTVSTGTVVELDQSLTPGFSIITEDTTAINTHYIRRQTCLTNDVVYTISIFVRKGTRSQIWIGDNGASGQYRIFDLNTKSVLSAGSSVAAGIQYVGNGAYRCWITLTATTANNNIDFGLAKDGAISYTGDGLGNAYIWGAQCEANPFMTSYIATNGTNGTRNADICSTPSGSVDPYWVQNGYIEFDYVPPTISSGKSYTIIGGFDPNATYGNNTLLLWRLNNTGINCKDIYFERKHNSSTGLVGNAGWGQLNENTVDIWDGNAHHIKLQWENFVFNGVRYMWQRIWIDNVLIASQNVAALYNSTAWIAPDKIYLSDGNTYGILSNVVIGSPTLPVGATIG